MRRIALALVLHAAPLAAQDYHQWRPKPKEGFSYPECFCTNRGARVELGETACLRVDGRAFTARCAMSLNNPAWRRERDGCDPEELSRPAPPASVPPVRG